MKSSNPMFRNGAFGRVIGSADRTERMTISGTLNKSLLLILIAFVTAVGNAVIVSTSPGLGMAATMFAAIVGLVLAIVTSVKPENSPITGPIYAAVEGVVLGGLSAFLSHAYPGIVGQAVPLTILVTMIMLGLYRAGVLRATPMFTKVIIIATASIAIFYAVDLVLMLFGTQLPFLFTPTPIGIGISMVIVGVAALNLILDFDLIERGALAGAPKYMEWYGAFSLCVTLFWLYIEILRLLSLLNRR